MAINTTSIQNWVIYKITSPSGRVYIGVSSDYKKRLKAYKSKNCKSQYGILHSLQKYGFSSHSVDIIEKFTSTKAYAYDKEMFWIRSYMSNCKKYPEHRGMNMTNGGEGRVGSTMSEENKKAQSVRLLGKKASEETRRKMSESHIGKKINRVFTAEQILASRERGRKLRHTEEAKAKIGAASKGNKYGVGNKWSEERKEFKRVVMTGNKYGTGPSENNKIALRESAKKRRKPVKQYDTEGVFLAAHESAIDAAESSNVSVHSVKSVLYGKCKQIKGFVFKYK